MSIVIHNHKTQSKTLPAVAFLTSEVLTKAEAKAGWRKVGLKNVGKIITGKTPPTLKKELCIVAI